jgi:hypothetical protein
MVYFYCNDRHLLINNMPKLRPWKISIISDISTTPLSCYIFPTSALPYVSVQLFGHSFYMGVGRSHLGLQLVLWAGSYSSRQRWRSLKFYVWDFSPWPLYSSSLTYVLLTYNQMNSTPIRLTLPSSPSE